MNEYSGKSERHLRDLLEDCTNFQERRKIRAAIKELHRPPSGPSHPVHPALNGVCPQGALDTVYRATPYSPSLPSCPPLSSSSSPSSASSSTMASASLSSRPPLSHGLMSHRRGTLAALPSFSRDRFGSGSPTTTTTTTTDGLGSREGGPARDGESLSRLSLKESRFLSASVFDKPDSRNGVSSHSDSAPQVPHHHLPPNLHRKRHSLGHVLSGSLLPGFEASSSTGGSLFADGLHAARPAVTSPGDAPKRINIRRSSHVFLSDGEAHSPTPPLLSPFKRDDSDRDDDVFVVPDKKAGSLLTSASASSVGDVRGADSRLGEGRPMESTPVQGREAVSVTTAGYCPVAMCEDEDELLDLLCTTEDIKERLKIRARLRQLKEAREGRRAAHGGQQAASTRPGAPFIAPTPASPLNPPQHPPAPLPVTRTHPPATDGTRAGVTSQREQAGPSHRQYEAKVKAGTDQRPDLSQEAPGGTLPEAAARGSGEGAGVGVDVGDYGHIQDIEELRRLLSATLDFDEKRKIRNVMRELRKTGDGEKARSDAPLTKPAEDSHRKDHDARATRSTVTLKETDQVKVGPSPGERTSSVGRSQSLRAERDAAASVASVAYTPFERLPSQAGKKEKDISALVSEKVQAALSEKLLQTAPASAESRDKPLGQKGNKAQGISLRSDSEAERKGRESDLSALVKEKVQAALSEKIHVAQPQPGKDSSSELRQEKSAFTAALQRSEKKPVITAVTVSDSKRTPGSRANSKSWEDTLRGPNASPPVPKTSHKAAVKSAAVSTDKNAKQEEPGRSPVSQKGDDQVLPNKSDSKSWDAAEDGRSRAAGLADRQNPPEAKDATDSPRRPSSPFRRERGQLQRPSSPLQSRSLQKDRATPSPIQPGNGEVIGRRPSSPLLRSPSSPRLRSPSSPLQPHSGGHDKRPASPFQSISAQHNRRASSPFLSEGPPLDRRAASPLQAPVRPQIRRPSSPFLSEGSSRRAASPLPSQVGQRDKGPASPLLLGDLPQQPQLTARSFQPVIRKEEKRLSALSQQQQQPETSKGFVVVATKKRDASPARVPEQLQEKKPPCQSSESQVILTEFSARQAQPVATRLLTDEAERGSEADRNSAFLAVDLPSELQRDSSVEESTEKPEKQNTSVTRKESFNWDLLNKVKARLSSRSESLSSEEKYQAAIRARASLSSSSDSLDNDAKKIAEVKGEEKSADDRKVRQPAVDVVKSTEQRKPTEPVHTVRPVQTADQRRASEPRYKEVRELARNTPARKDDPELKESPTGAAKEDQQQPLSDFQRLDKGLKPSVSKSRVSTLADKFAAADSGSETPGSQLKFFAVGSKQSKPVRKTDSFKASPRAENSEAGPKSRLPRRAESLNAHDSQRRPVLVRKQVSPVAEVEARTQGDAQTPRAQDLRRDADSSEAKASLRDSNASRAKVRATEAKPVRAVEVERSGGTGTPPVAEGVRAEDDKATAGASTPAMTKDHPAAVTSSAPQPGSIPAAKKVPGSAAMEQAFSALLDDIETFSASEGTGSDLDLSDSDETLVDKPPSASAGALKDSGPSLKDDNGNSIKDTIGVAKDTNSKDAAGVSASAVKRSNSLNRGSNAVPLAPVAEVAEYRALTTERKEDGPVAAMTKEDSGIGMGAGDLDDVDTAAPESTKAETIQSLADADTPTTTLPSLTDDEDGTAAAAAAQTQPLATLEEEDSAPPPPPLSPPPPLPAPADPEMTSSAFLVLKPQTEAAGQAPLSQPPQLERTVSVIEDVGGVTEDQEAEVTYRKVSKDDEHSRVVTIRSKVRRTPSNADEEIRDTVVETDFHAPGGAAVKDRDVIRSRRKITPRGSNYYQRTVHRTRRVRDQEGSDFVEHDVCVESDNTSISEGRSWGSKTVTKVSVDRPSGGLPPALDELARLPQLEAPRTGKGPGAGAPLVRMDMSKASSGYGSVSGSEEEDKDTSPPPDLKTAGSLVGAPEVLAPLKDVSTVEGHGAVLECTLSAQPAPEVTWYLGDKKLDTSEERFSAHFDAASGKATLTLQEAVVGDGGEYTCVCSNEFGEASTRSSLLVKPAGSSETTVVPMFLTKLPNKTLNDGDSLLLECDVIGSPEPNIRWLRDGLDLPDSLSFNSQYDGRVARLRVERMVVEDEGLFECVAENSAGKVSMDARVHVQKRNKAPSFSSCLQDVTVELGHNVCLRCQVSGTPAPSVFWRRNGLIVADTPDFLQSLTRGLARLEIFGVKDKHGGQYECVAKNDAGDAVCSCYLTVTHPKATEPPAEAAPPPVTTRRTFKKLSEPQHSDIISAVLVSAGKKTGVQRAQSFSPQSAPAPAPKDSARPLEPLRAFSVQAAGAGEARPLEGEREALNGAGVSADSASVGDTDVKAVSRYTVQWRDREGRLVDGPEGGSPSPSSTATSSTSSGPPTTTTTRDNASSSAAADSPRPAATTTTTTTSSPPQAAPDQDSQLPMPVKTSPPAAARGRASPSPERKLSEPPKASPQAGKSPRSMVSQLRAQFNKLEETADGAGGSGGGIRRWHSMPLKQERPTVVKRGPSQLAVEDRGSAAAAAAAAAVRGADATETATMSSYDHINDEEELHKLMNATESFEERKKIRTRLREIRDKQRDGSTTVTKKTETTTTVKQTSGFGGVQYGAPRAAPELNTRNLKEQLSRVSGPGSSGSIAIKTESWSSVDGVAHKAQKTESWGAKPQGPRGAMAAFKQMDAANPAPKPNGLVTVSLAKRAASTMRKNAVAIKEEILRFVKANTDDYENIQVTNFSSSWNNGLAFCALIHHFYPDAFDYSQLDPKNRRYNFNLAFDTAEKLADIAPLLDVEDMVRMKNPDWKCVFTYVQSIYRHLRDHENNKTKVPAEA